MKKILALIPFISLIFLMSAVAKPETKDCSYVISECDVGYLFTSVVQGEEESVFCYTVEQCLELAEWGACIYLDGLSLTDEVTFFGAFTLMGSLTLEGASIYIPPESCITMRDFTVEILGDSRGIVTDGKLICDNAKIHSDRGVPLSVVSGSCEIMSGEILSSSEEAINSRGVLTVSDNCRINGVAFDIVSETPIRLVANGAVFCPATTLRLKIDKTAKKGTFTEAIEIFSRVMPERVEVYSGDGQPHALTPDPSESSEDSITYGIYLPYKVSIYNGNRLVYREDRLSGESYSNSYETERVGYRFKGLYEDAEFSVPYDLRRGIVSDTDLFLSYELSEPLFEISGMKFVYNGYEQD